MSDLQVRGPLYGATGTPSPFTADLTGAQRTTDAHGRYAEAVRRGNVYSLGTAAAAATAYVGANGGTPLLAAYNPVGSGKQLELLAIAFAVKTVPSAIGWSSLGLWGGPTANITGTQTAPTSALSLATSGSAMRGFVNTALTGSTALGFLMPLLSHFWGTSVGVGLSTGWVDVGGLYIAVPGNMLGVGLSVAPASGAYDIMMAWEETPYLQ